MFGVSSQHLCLNLVTSKPKLLAFRFVSVRFVDLMHFELISCNELDLLYLFEIS